MAAERTNPQCQLQRMRSWPLPSDRHLSPAVASRRPNSQHRRDDPSASVVPPFHQTFGWLPDGFSVIQWLPYIARKT